MSATIDEAIAAALAKRGLRDATIAPSDGLGANVRGAMERSGRTIFTARGLSDEERRFVKAHELGHYLLHTDPLLETTVLSYAGETGLVEGYSERSLVEVQADVFASEFLCPSDWLRDVLATSGATPRSIAVDQGLPPDVVVRQAIRAILRPLERKHPSAPWRSCVPERAVAASRATGNLLVEGAPGSGKTTACVARVAHLLDRSVPAAAIAVVCHDEAAARRLRADVIAGRPDAAQAWFGTLRAFALELLGACPSRIGRTPDFKVVDHAAALAVVEAASCDAEGRGAAVGAAAIHRSIKRCKKASLGPADLVGASQGMHGGEASTLARVWKDYEERLAAADVVDATDLTGLAERALRSAEVRERTRTRFLHLVIDDFETLCEADHALVRRVVAAGTTLFATGGATASIHRFHGARPEAIATFETDFPGASRMRLPRERRDPPAIDDAIRRFLGEVVPKREGRAARLAVSVAPTVEGEAAAIARRIRSRRAAGFAYRDQAVLARTHDLLADIAGRLVALGIPVSHLGELHNRPEVADLMAVVSLVAGTSGAWLERVASLPIYGVGAADAASMIGHARGRAVSVLEAMAEAERVEGLTAVGRSGLNRLARDLAGLGPSTPPWIVLTTWLFERSDYLDALGRTTDAESRREAVALVLGVCDDQMRQGDRDLSRLSARIGWVRSLDQETSYRASDADDDGTDRVRMMTVHAAKGRLFDVVHLPGLAAGRLPIDRAPKDDLLGGIEALSSTRAQRDAEERSVFAVALTRARSHLHLSRAERYDRRAVGRSRFLDELGDLIVERRVGDDGRPATSRRTP